MSEQFQTPVEKSAKLIPLAHKYMTEYFPELVHALQ